MNLSICAILNIANKTPFCGHFCCIFPSRILRSFFICELCFYTPSLKNATRPIFLALKSKLCQMLTEFPHSFIARLNSKFLINRNKISHHIRQSYWYTITTCEIDCQKKNVNSLKRVGLCSDVFDVYMLRLLLYYKFTGKSADCWERILKIGLHLAIPRGESRIAPFLDTQYIGL